MYDYIIISIDSIITLSNNTNNVTLGYINNPNVYIKASTIAIFILINPSYLKNLNLHLSLKDIFL